MACLLIIFHYDITVVLILQLYYQLSAILSLINPLPGAVVVLSYSCASTCSENSWKKMKGGMLSYFLLLLLIFYK